MYSGRSIAITRVQDKPTRLSFVVYRYGVCRISDPVSPAGHRQAAVLVPEHRRCRGSKPADLEKLPEGLSQEADLTGGIQGNYV